MYLRICRMSIQKPQGGKQRLAQFESLVGGIDLFCTGIISFFFVHDCNTVTLIFHDIRLSSDSLRPLNGESLAGS